MLDGKLYAPVREFVSFLNDRFPRMPALQVDWDSQTRRVYVRREAEGGSLVRIRTLPIRGGVRMSARPVSVGATKGAPSVAAGAEPEAALVGEGAFAAGVTLLGVGDARGALVQLREARTQGMADAQPVADWLHGAPQALGTLRLRWSEDLPKGQVLLDGVPVEAETFAVVTTAGEHRLTWQPQDGPQTAYGPAQLPPDL
ncbi:MAG: hypothetical protein K0Q72_5168 [Armatimonadetes bacterium]|nr:hypothetical protein [Armatimonadota bacterium]